MPKGSLFSLRMFTLCLLLSLFVNVFWASNPQQDDKHEPLTSVRAEQLGEQHFQQHYRTLTSDPADAIRNLRLSATYFTQASQLMKAASSLARIGQIYTNLGLYNLALEYLLKVNRMLAGQPPSSQIAWLYSDIGNVYYAMGQTDLAEPYYWQGLRMMKSLKDSFGESVMLNNIGLCKIKHGDTENAFSFFRQALKLREASANRFAVLHSWSVIGEAYQSIGNHDLALHYFHKVYDGLTNNISPADASISLKATTAISMSKLYRELGDHAIADKYLEDAGKLLEESQDIFRLNEVLLMKADKLVEDKKADKAKALYLKVFAGATANGFLEQARNAAKELGQIYMLDNDKHKALEYWDYYATYYDSLYAQRSPADLVRLHSSVQNDLKELENKELKRRQVLRTRFTVSTLALLILIIILFIRGTWVNKKHILGLRQLADAAHEGILIHTNGYIIEVNNRFTEMLGLSRADCIGHRIDEINNLVVDSSLMDHVREGGEQNYEIDVVTPNMGKRQLEIMSRPYNYLNKKVRVASVRDITEKNEFIRALLETQKKLKDLNSTKDKLFSIIAHDLKNPFSAIIGFSEVMMNNQDKFNADQVHEMVSLIHQTSGTAYALLQNLLQWAKLQIGAVYMYPREQTVLPIIHEVLSLHKASLTAKDQRVSIDCHEDVIIYADTYMLHSVLNNVLGNAIKFSYPNSEIIIRVLSGEQTVIEVQDKGMGMDEDTLSTLFRIDMLQSRPGTNKERGTGIGLILCKDMVEKHGGSIYVESKAGEGSIVKVFFPGKAIS